MIEKELRDSLRIAVTDEPPMGFDPDDAVTKIGRKVRRRRATIGVVAATLMALGSAVAVQQSIGRGAEVEIASQPPAPPTTSGEAKIDFPWPPPGLALPGRYTQRQVDERVKAVRDNAAPAVAMQLPQATNVQARGFRTMTAGEPSPGPNVLEGLVEFRDQVGVTGVNFGIFSPRYAFPPPYDECVQKPSSTAVIEACKVSKLPDGTALVVDRTRFVNAAPGTAGEVMANALHYRLDGVVVRVSAYSYNPAGSGPKRDQAALTDEQLVALATNRVFTM